MNTFRKSLKLCLLEDASEMGGVQHSSLNLLLGLKVDSSINPMIILPEEGVFSGLCRDSEINYCILPKPALKGTSFSIWNDWIRLPNFKAMWQNWHQIRWYANQLYSFWQENPPDIVLTKGMGAHFAGGLACKTAGIPCIWHLQDFISERYLGLYKKIFGYYANRLADFLIADGMSIIQQLPNSAQRKTKVIFNGVDVDTFYQPDIRDEIRKILNIPTNAYVIGHIARLTPWKGQHLLLAAFSKYAAKHPNAFLLLIGSPLFGEEEYLSYLKNKIAQYNLTNRVIMPGYRTDLGAILAAMDIFIYPSVEKDTSPLSLIGALAAGLPAGVSSIPGLEEMVNGCKGVQLFKNRSIKEMEEIMMYFESEDRRKSAIEINRQWAKDHFSLETYVMQITQVIKQFV